MIDISTSTIQQTARYFPSLISRIKLNLSLVDILGTLLVGIQIFRRGSGL